MRGQTIVACSLAVLAVATCGGEDQADEAAPAVGGQAAGTTIEVIETDFAIEPARIAVEQAGKYTFRIANRGQAPHALEVDGESFEE